MSVFVIYTSSGTNHSIIENFIKENVEDSTRFFYENSKDSFVKMYKKDLEAGNIVNELEHSAVED